MGTLIYPNVYLTLTSDNKQSPHANFKEDLDYCDNN